jgi:hypothetical protein
MRFRRNPVAASPHVGLEPGVPDATRLTGDRFFTLF